ncbi:hypothetical protein [Amycolatopsis sp. cmx-4-68]|uniref:hypothetical protein n=1 Tax=Amycolatopsis sp. cmx-4-68 TaxID=2790938 RepID=UPI00397BD2AF
MKPTDVFTWHEIENDWLSGGKLGLSNEAVVRAFNVVATQFGRAWVEASRVHNGSVTSGALPTVRVATLGQFLESLNDAPGSAHLLDKVQDGLSDARAELLAIHLVRSGMPGLSLEVEPEIVVGGRNRRPDFRVQRQEEGWTYVEVAQANTSQAQADVRRGLERLTQLVDNQVGNFTLEIFLKREPNSDEVEVIAAEVTSRLGAANLAQAELGDGLGTLYWNTTAPGVGPTDNHGHPYTPRFSAMRIAAQGESRRHICVRWPFTDERAQAFLDSETKQLPKDAPGLIMIQTSEAIGAMKAWRALIARRFQPTIYTRVSAVCLFSSGLRSTPQGEEWRPETKLILNPHARFPLPEWIVDQLERFRSEELDLPLADDHDCV